MTLVLGIYQVGGVATPVNTTPASISRSGNVFTAVPGVWTNAGAISGLWYINGSPTSQTALVVGLVGLLDGDTVFYRETTLGVSADSNVIIVAPTYLYQLQVIAGSFRQVGGIRSPAPMVVIFAHLMARITPSQSRSMTLILWRAPEALLQLRQLQHQQLPSLS